MVRRRGLRAMMWRCMRLEGFGFHCSEVHDLTGRLGG